MCRITVQKVPSAPSALFAPIQVVVPAPVEEVSKKRPLPSQEPEQDDNSGYGDEKLRSGKWTHEEELYANALIEKFENGTLSDCPDGKTLRAYLSKKLHCIPMRVSKKYGGKCIGKHAFSRDLTILTTGDEELARLSKECWDSIARRISKRRRRRNRPSSNQNKDLFDFKVKEEEEDDCDEDSWDAHENSSGSEFMNDVNSSDDNSSNDRTDREEEMLFDDFQLDDLFAQVDSDDMFNIEKCGDFDWSVPLTSESLSFVF